MIYADTAIITTNTATAANYAHFAKAEQSPATTVKTCMWRARLKPAA